MKPPPRRGVPTGAAITVTALALLATIVMGRDDANKPATAIEPTSAPPPPSARIERPVSAEDLDLDRLARSRREAGPQDLFATRSWLPAPATVPEHKPAPPPAPSAPPLPFKYLGRMADSEKLVVFLEQGTNTLSVKAGDVLDNTYQVEMTSETAVRFIYLPLGTRQLLSIPASN